MRHRDRFDDNRLDRTVVTVGVSGSDGVNEFCDSVSTTSPKMVCLRFRCGVLRTVMKNCDPLVPGPTLALANRYGRSNCSGWNSSLNWYPGRPRPVPVGSPLWIMKPSITRGTLRRYRTGRKCGPLRFHRILFGALREAHEIGHSLGRIFTEQGDLDVATVGVQGSRSRSKWSSSPGAVHSAQKGRRYSRTRILLSA
jgi:hypothetical protein